MLRSKKIASIGIVAIAVLLAVSACGSKSSTTSSKSPAVATNSKSVAVTIHTFAFNPNPLTIKVGTKVTWTNEDNIHHTVTSGKRDHPDNKFDGDLKSKGKTYSHVFTKAGNYSYFCEIHPGMDAEIIVK